MNRRCPLHARSYRLWTDEFAFRSQPGQGDIPTELFYDYRNNVAAYPRWQDWVRKNQPRLLVLWGKYDTSFDISEPETYRRDVPHAEVHVLDAGHFALDTAADQIADLVRGFRAKERPVEGGTATERPSSHRILSSLDAEKGLGHGY